MILGVLGDNLQNVSDALRRTYIPDEGKILVQADQSGADARIVAFQCRAGRYRDLFNYGIKPHSYVAADIFQSTWEDLLGYNIKDILESPIKDLQTNQHWQELAKLIKSSDAWPENKRYYYFGKKTIHAGNYGVRGPTLSDSILEDSGGKVRLSPRTTGAFLAKYFKRFPEIADNHENIRSTLRRTRTLKNFFGYPRTFYEIVLTDEVFRNAFIFVPQSTVAIITHIAYANLQQYIEDNHKNWDLLENCHDSYLAQCPVSEELALASVMKDFLEQELTAPDGTVFKMKAEASSGYNWGKENKENPEGMKEVKFI